MTCARRRRLRSLRGGVAHTRVTSRWWPYPQAAMPRRWRLRRGVLVRVRCLSHAAFQADHAPECGPHHGGGDGDEYEHASSPAMVPVLRRDLADHVFGSHFRFGIHGVLGPCSRIDTADHNGGDQPSVAPTGFRAGTTDRRDPAGRIRRARRQRWEARRAVTEHAGRRPGPGRSVVPARSPVGITEDCPSPPVADWGCARGVDQGRGPDQGGTNDAAGGN